MNYSSAKKELFSIVKQVKAYINAEKDSGTEEFFIHGGISPKKDASPDQSKTRLLFQIRQRVSGCEKCALFKTRTNIVFGDGDPDAKLLFVGEAPGADEDAQGLPFVGKAGKLLTKMIEAMGLSRGSVYICNVLKCRPPENRSPLPEEVSACGQYLLDQIDIISPKVICCLGRHATQALLKTEAPISKIRGKRLDLNGVALVPTFHPAYLLRNPSAKKEAWEDLKKINKILSEG
ncbi:MAG: uracil-DNA glycosylase [Candidatus Omnitrophota bacterium]